MTVSYVLYISFDTLDVLYCLIKYSEHISLAKILDLLRTLVQKVGNTCILTWILCRFEPNSWLRLYIFVFLSESRFKLIATVSCNTSVIFKAWFTHVLLGTGSQ